MLAEIGEMMVCPIGATLGALIVWLMEELGAALGCGAAGAGADAA